MSRQDGGLLRPLHHRVVDRDLLGAAEGGGVQHQEVEISAGLCDRLDDGIDNVRLESLELGLHRRGIEDEVARVPEIAVEEILRGRRGIGLLDESGDRTRGLANRLARPDIAITGGGMGRRNADGHDPSFSRDLARPTAGLDEEGAVLHDMVGREDADDGPIIGCERELRRRGDRGSRIPSRRLEHDLGADADGLQLIEHREAVLRIGHHDRASEDRTVREQAHNPLEGRDLSEKRNELLGHAVTRDRPKARACTATHDDRNDFRRHEAKLRDFASLGQRDHLTQRLCS